MKYPSGHRLGPYEILSLVGAGGMGEVYRARDVRLDRVVAIKVLSRAFCRDAERVAQFDQEAKLLASLNHPNVGAIYGLEEAEGEPHLVLEFVQGETLATRLTRGALPPAEAVEVCAQIAAAVEAAHARGVVHRDLKPANVMLTDSGVVKVLDFGLAMCGRRFGGTAGEGIDGPAMAAAETAATQATEILPSTPGLVSGTAAYMSPEQARGRPLDHLTDIWSLGCVLFECLSGRRAFAGETLADIFAGVLTREPDWKIIPTATPPRLLTLAQRCLRKEAADRVPDASEFRRELAAIALEFSAPRRAATTAPLPSLAVLYFENLSSDPESDYFCAGMTEDILTDLSKIKELRVASRTAVARYRGSAVDLSKAAAELGVGAILEGSVRRAGDRVRITAQLVNVADGFHLWAERYDRVLQDVFAVQEEIASAIAGALRIALDPTDARALLRDRPGDVRAYDLYLQGRALYNRRTPAAFRQALELFTQATAIEPGYALAWAGVADCFGQLIQNGMTEDVAGTARQGLEAARRAIALDPKLVEGHKAEALVLLMAGDRSASQAALLRAIEADPRHAPTLINLCVDALLSADLAGAERWIRKALDVDPRDPFAVGTLAGICQLTRRDDEAVGWTHQLRRLSSDPFFVTDACVTRLLVYLEQGNLVNAAQAIREGLDDGADPAMLQPFESQIAARSGKLDEARRWLTGIRSPLDDPGWPEACAVVAVQCGNLDFAAQLMMRPSVRAWSKILIRLNSGLHPLLEREEFGPPCCELTLVWPLEAPPVDEQRRRLFATVRVETGRPETD